MLGEGVEPEVVGEDGVANGAVVFISHQGHLLTLGRGDNSHVPSNAFIEASICESGNWARNEFLREGMGVKSEHSEGSSEMLFAIQSLFF